MALPIDEQIIEGLGLRRERRWSVYDHPNLIRLASVTVFLLLWEFFGRKTDPILFTYPTAVAEASERIRAGVAGAGGLLSHDVFPIVGAG